LELREGYEDEIRHLSQSHEDELRHRASEEAEEVAMEPRGQHHSGEPMLWGRGGGEDQAVDLGEGLILDHQAVDLGEGLILDRGSELGHLFRLFDNEVFEEDSSGRIELIGEFMTRGVARQVWTACMHAL